MVCVFWSGFEGDADGVAVVGGDVFADGIDAGEGGEVLHGGEAGGDAVVAGEGDEEDAGGGPGGGGEVELLEVGELVHGDIAHGAHGAEGGDGVGAKLLEDGIPRVVDAGAGDAQGAGELREGGFCTGVEPKEVGEDGGVHDEVLEVDGRGGAGFGAAGAGAEEGLAEGVQEVCGPGVPPGLYFLELVIFQAVGGEGCGEGEGLGGGLSGGGGAFPEVFTGAGGDAVFARHGVGMLFFGGEGGECGGDVYHTDAGGTGFGDDEAIVFPAFEGALGWRVWVEAGGVDPRGEEAKAGDIARAAGGKGPAGGVG